TIIEKLESKNYLFNFDDFGNCFLEDTDDFKFPEKIYDIDKDLRELVKKSYESNKSNLGVLLTGNKGQGKSVTAKLICKDLGLPVVMINKPIPSNINFIKFLKEIKQDYVLMLDEFGKIFDSSSYNEEGNKVSYHTQESFLSLMDGALTSEFKTVFLMTSNEEVNSYLINRPSRIKFVKEYDELPEELFELIVEDKLVNKEFKKDLQEHISFLNLNVDLLINIISDINLFNKPFSTFANLYNYKFEKYRYDVWISKEGGDERWEKTVYLDYKPKYTHNYISSWPVKKMIKCDRDEVIFESEYHLRDNTKENVRIRMTPVTKYISF
ncbi:MAG TPA: ATP-binding protein, partial [Allocoleopsis sp.]